MTKSKKFLAITIFYLLSIYVEAQSLNEIQNQYLVDSIINLNIKKNDECFEQIFHEAELDSTLNCSNAEEIEADQYSFFKIQFNANEPIPDFIHKIIPGLILQSAIKGGFTLELGMPNDNKLLGLWGLTFNEDGDDYGFTHGSSLSFKKTNQDGLRTTIEGATNLYTKKAGLSRIGEDEKRHTNQYFTNENIIKLLVDNIPKNKTMYFKAGVGWINLDSKNFKNKLMASGQQISWHKFITNLNPEFAMIPHNIASDLSPKHGLSLEAFIGIQKNLISPKSSCRLQIYGQSGGEYNSLGGSYFSGQAGAVFYFQKPKSKWAMKLGGSLSSQIHQYGSSYEGNIHAGVAKGRTTVSFSYYQQYGDLINYVQYNQPNKDGKIEPTMTVTIGYVFGSWKNN